MRLAITLGRLLSRKEASLCFGPASKVLRSPFRPAHRRTICTSLFQTGSRSRSQSWRTYRAVPRVLMAATGSGLAAAAFVELAEEGSAHPDDTGERRMLEVSRAEIRKTAGENDGTLGWLRRRLVVCLDLYIWEPVCTGFRFLQLVVIFVPVLLAVPAIWVGSRIPERDNERSGTLWWYGFLVQAMEWAGPAFIKVLINPPWGLLPRTLTSGVDSSASGLLHGPTSSPTNCATSCRNCMPTPPLTLSARRSG